MGRHDTRRLKNVLKRVFTPASPVRDLRLLVGREPLTKRLLRAFDTAGKSVVVYGGRGVGKTSVCLATAGSQVVPRSPGRAGSFESVIVDLFNEYGLAWPAHETEETEASDKSAKVGLAGSGGALEHHRAKRYLIRHPTLPLTPDQLAEKLSGVDDIVVIDDFHTLPEATRLAFSELIKKLSDRTASLTLVLIGVASAAAELVHNFEEVETRVEAIEVRPLNASELALLISQAFERISAEFERRVSMKEEVIELILGRAGDQPNEVHQYCFDCGLMLCDRLDNEETTELSIGRPELELAEALFRSTVG